jgi:hypothetical protein
MNTGNCELKSILHTPPLGHNASPTGERTTHVRTTMDHGATDTGDTNNVAPNTQNPGISVTDGKTKGCDYSTNIRDKIGQDTSNSEIKMNTDSNNDPGNSSTAKTEKLSGSTMKVTGTPTTGPMESKTGLPNKTRLPTKKKFKVHDTEAPDHELFIKTKADDDPVKGETLMKDEDYTSSGEPKNHDATNTDTSEGARDIKYKIRKKFDQEIEEATHTNVEHEETSARIKGSCREMPLGMT